MTLPTSRLAYQDCYDLFQRAYDSEKGIRVVQDSYEAAFHMRTRMNYARKIDREDNLDIHEVGMPLYGRSIFDGLVCRIKKAGDEFYLYIEKRQVVEEDVEDLAEIEDELLLPAPQSQLQIEHQPVEEAEVISESPPLPRRAV